jgi:hypothetical protein
MIDGFGNEANGGTRDHAPFADTVELLMKQSPLRLLPIGAEGGLIFSQKDLAR